MFETIFSTIVALILIGILIGLLAILLKIDERRYKEHKEFKDNILKEVRRFNDCTSMPIEFKEENKEDI